MKRKKRKLLLKFLSVIFSFFIWFYVLSSTSVILNKEIEVKYVVPVGYSLASKVPKYVKYKLKGPRAIINELIDSKETLVINLKDSFSVNNRRYNISYINYKKKFPFSVKTLDVFPKSISIYLIRSSIKRVPLVINNEFSLNEDLLIESMKSDIKKIRLSGAKNVLSSIKQIETYPVDLSKIKESSVIKVKILSPDNRIDFAPKFVDVKVRVKKNVNSLSLKKVPINFISKKRVISSSQKTVDIVLSMNRQIDEKELRKQITISAKIPFNDANFHNISLNFNLPDEVRLLKSSVESIEVKTGMN